VLGLVGALLLGGAVFFVIYTMQLSSDANAAKNRLEIDWGSSEAPFRPPVYIALTKPLLQGSYLKMAAEFWKPHHLEAWRRKIRSAGLHRNLQAEHVVASKFWLTLILAAFLGLNFIFSSNPGPVWLPPVLLLVAFFFPNIDLNTKRETRQADIRLAMPYVMDLMTLSMEAGLEFMGAVQRVVERAPKGPLLEELSDMLKDIQLGKSRAEAMRKMAQAIDIPEITSLVAVMVSADQMGSPVGPVLRAQSETIRVERLMKAEKLAAQASQKIIFPLVFLILPAVFLIIFGPLVLSALGVK
jgi:tight adherence protein C